MKATHWIPALCLLALCVSPVMAERPNVLFIAIDDMNDWTTLFDDRNPIQTPNLKRLAERGCFFTQAYCASPGCNPSRTQSSPAIDRQPQVFMATPKHGD